MEVRGESRSLSYRRLTLSEVTLAKRTLIGFGETIEKKRPKAESANGLENQRRVEPQSSKSRINRIDYC